MHTGLEDTRGRERVDADEGPAARVRCLVEEACNKGQLAVHDEVLARPDGQAAEPITAADTAARLRQLLAAFRAAVPDARWTIVEQIVQGDTVVTRLSVQGTFSGPLLATGPVSRDPVATEARDVSAER